MALTLNDKHVKQFVSENELVAIQPQIDLAEKMIKEKSGLGNDFLGWVNLPNDYDKDQFQRILKASEKIKKQSQVLLVIGIGGSYLGARAGIELLKSPFYNSLSKDTPDIYFVGNNIHPTYLNEIISIIDGKDFSVNIISKSGTTTEPALAFRVFRDLLIKKYGEDGAKDRIYATTDKARGTLKGLADREGYESFVIPDDVGGRFSVLTPVGLLPLACAGIDIDQVMKGASAAIADFAKPNNDCHKYVAYRHALHRKGKSIEMLISYDPAFTSMNEWFKQLFGESEGKDQKGIFPSSAIFSMDLHSMGQFIQDGSRIMFETVVSVKKPKSDFFIDNDPDDIDGLNFLSNQNMSIVNEKAMQGTIIAHTEGGCPNLVLEAPEMNEYELGYMIYFFEKACGLSGYVLGINPFDQPGVEDYKRNMFALLNKPGFEKQKAELEAKLS